MLTDSSVAQNNLPSVRIAHIAFLPRQKWSAKRLNINLSDAEYDLLVKYSTFTQRDMTDVIRELIRGLQKKLPNIDDH